MLNLCDTGGILVKATAGGNPEELMSFAAYDFPDSYEHDNDRGEGPCS
jgi:hypothetical protein